MRDKKPLVVAGMFGNVVVVIFQSIVYLEMHQNDFFLIFKKLFLISAHQNDSKILKNINFKQKNSKFFGTRVGQRSQPVP